MSRPWRIEYAGVLYHLLSRGTISGTDQGNLSSFQLKDFKQGLF